MTTKEAPECLSEEEEVALIEHINLIKQTVGTDLVRRAEAAIARAIA